MIPMITPSPKSPPSNNGINAPTGAELPSRNGVNSSDFISFYSSSYTYVSSSFLVVLLRLLI